MNMSKSLLVKRHFAKKAISDNRVKYKTLYLSSFVDQIIISNLILLL